MKKLLEYSKTSFNKTTNILVDQLSNVDFGGDNLKMIVSIDSKFGNIYLHKSIIPKDIELKILSKIDNESYLSTILIYLYYQEFRNNDFYFPDFYLLINNLNYEELKKFVEKKLISIDWNNIDNEQLINIKNIYHKKNTSLYLKYEILLDQYYLIRKITKLRNLLKNINYDGEKKKKNKLIYSDNFYFKVFVCKIDNIWYMFPLKKVKNIVKKYICEYDESKGYLCYKLKFDLDLELKENILKELKKLIH